MAAAKQSMMMRTLRPLNFVPTPAKKSTDLARGTNRFLARRPGQG
jgi:hypothetical protein